MNINQILAMEKDDIIARYCAGEDAKSIGKTFDCSGASIYTALKTWGVQLKTKSHDLGHLLPDIEQRVSQGQSVYGIARELQIPPSSLHSILKKRGCDTSKHLNRCKYKLKDYIAEISSLYTDGYSCPQIAELFECDGNSINKVLRKNGVKLRFNYTVNEDYFENIDTEEKAYTLGFFVADGCNNEKFNVMQILNCDLDVLEKIKNSMSYTGPITHEDICKVLPNRRQKHNLRISSKKICDALTKLGCPPRKTFVTRYPTNEEIPPDLQVHYLRGLFDGDGSLYRTQGRWNVCYCGTREVLTGVRDKVYADTGIMMSIYAQKKVFAARISRQSDVRKFLDWLYRDATIYMQRKYDKYQQCLSELTSTHPSLGVLTPTG